MNFVKNYSLSLRLKISLLIGFVVFLIALIIPLFYQLNKLQNSLLDYQLKQIAHTINDILGDEDSSKDLDALIRKGNGGNPYGEEDVEWHIDLQIWLDQDLIYASASDLNLDIHTKNGFSNRRIGSPNDPYTARIYTFKNGATTIQVMHSSLLREDLINIGIVKIILPILLILIIFIVIINLIVRRGLRPLSDLDHQIKNRDLANLDLFYQSDNSPTEISNIIQSLNILLQKLKNSFHAHQQFIAVAAHELRTPIAGFKIATDVLARQYIKPEGQAIFKELQNGIERSSVLVNQLLDLSRLESPTAYPLVPLDLIAEVRKSLIKNSLYAQAKNIELLLLGVSSLNIIGNATALQLLLNNLIVNALRHAPPNTKIEIELKLGKAPVLATLAVRDYGPGLSEAQRRSALEAFTRFDERNEGTGLGLAIAKQVAELHRATLTLKRPNSGPGLVAEIVFYAVSTP